MLKNGKKRLFSAVKLEKLHKNVQISNKSVCNFIKTDGHNCVKMQAKPFIPDKCRKIKLLCNQFIRKVDKDFGKSQQEIHKTFCRVDGGFHAVVRACLCGNGS